MEKLVNFLFEIGSLKKIARSRRQSFLIDDLYWQTAKDLFLQIQETDPADWWKNLYTAKRR